MNIVNAYACFRTNNPDYLLSNNHINDLIVHKFDFSDEEVLAYYISFLKSLSLKLNDKTLQFFYNEIDHDFPLYTEAIKFFNNPESMVRTAVRNLVLNVYKGNLPAPSSSSFDPPPPSQLSSFLYMISKCVTRYFPLLRSGERVNEDVHPRQDGVPLLLQHGVVHQRQVSHAR